VEAHWDLVVMIACPIHATWACQRCLSCGQNLGLYRPGLLKCSCGSSLRVSSPSRANPATREILEIIRTRVLDLLPFVDFGAGLPVADLHRLELRALVRVMAVVGMCTQIGLGRPRSRASMHEMVTGAAEAFSEWPQNFRVMLQRLAERNKEHAEGGDIRMCFAPFYNALFKARITGAADTLNFIKEAFLDYAINHWRIRWIDRRTLKGVTQNVNRRFVGASEIAVSLGNDRRTVLRHLGKPPDDPVYRGKIQPLFHAEQFAVNTNSVVEILNERTAAKETGLSVSVLRALRASGDFEVRHQMRTQVGYRGEDIPTVRRYNCSEFRKPY
jgi:hypothetical protein